jgi:hypothetical protein
MPALSILVCGFTCGTSSTLSHDKPAGGDMLDITAEVRRFVPQAMHDNSGPQGFAVYDATELVVLEPAGRRGTTLRIFHQAEQPADSPWRRIGQRLRMRLAKTSLEPGNQIFEGAVQDLKTL